MVNELQIVGGVMLVSLFGLLFSFLNNSLYLQIFFLGHLLGLLTYEIALYLIVNEK